MAERSSPTRRTCERAGGKLRGSKGGQNHRTSRTLRCPPPGASWRPKNQTNLSPEPSSSARTRARVPAMWPCQPPKRPREPAYKQRQVSVVKIWKRKSGRGNLEEEIWKRTSQCNWRTPLQFSPKEGPGILALHPGFAGLIIATSEFWLFWTAFLVAAAG